MTSLISYRKVIDSVTTHLLRLPENDNRQPGGQELATLPDGRTVVALFDGTVLSADQPQTVRDSLEPLPTPLPDDLRAAIKTASPQVRHIDNQVKAAIAERYAIDDEIKLLRLAPSDETLAYNAYVEECRAWGRAEKNKLGL